MDQSESVFDNFRPHKISTAYEKGRLKSESDIQLKPWISTFRTKQTPINPKIVATHCALLDLSLRINGDIVEIRIGAPASAAATALRGKYFTER